MGNYGGVFKESKNSASVGVVTPQTLKLELPQGGFKLEKGGILPEIVVTYESCGHERPQRDNVIFICHALTGDAHVAGILPGESQPSGWWEGMIGPGKGFDTNKWQIVCANILGGCKGTTGPSSINPTTGQAWGSAFPKITVGDIIEVHRMLLQQLGIECLAAVVGGSFGGMQALEWTIRHPDEVDRAIIIASAASLNPQALAFDIIGRRAITEDPHWNNGDYYDRPEIPQRGLASARKLAHITYLSQQLMESKFGREKRAEWLAQGADFHAQIDRNFGTFFQVESYLDHQGHKFIQRFDANSYLHITLAMDEYDAEECYETLEKAFANVTARVLVVSLSGDWLFTPEQSEELVTALVRQKKRVSHCHLSAAAGHDAFLTHIDDLKRIIRAFMSRPTNGTKLGGGGSGENVAKPSIKNWQMRLYQRVVDLIPPGSRVLDLGCGNGTLLKILRKYHGCSGNGVEIDIRQVVSAIKLGGDILQQDIDEGLSIIPENSFDIVVLSETLQAIKRPRELIQQILRVAPEAVITFPNFGCLEVRASLMFKGRMPKGRQLPYEWYDTPNIHLFTLKDFLVLCQEEGIEVLDLICKGRSLTERALLGMGFKNLGASSVIARVGR